MYKIIFDKPDMPPNAYVMVDFAGELEKRPFDHDAVLSHDSLKWWLYTKGCYYFLGAADIYNKQSGHYSLIWKRQDPEHSMDPPLVHPSLSRLEMLMFDPFQYYFIEGE